MNINNLLKAKEILSKEISDNIKSHGTYEYGRLLTIQGELNVLIQIIIKRQDDRDKAVQTN